MRKVLGLMVLSIGILGCSAPPSADPGGVVDAELSPEQQRARAQEWFQDAKFGLFIHWGIYSVLGRGEWVMHQEKMSIEEYEKLARQFNPVQYDPESWVSLAKEAGMKYICITSKHHDGFAMWDSNVSDYNVVKATPYGKDVLKMLADECRRQGVKLFFYHSHLDWHHPDYYPRGSTGQHSGRPDGGDFQRYLDFMDAQVAELAGGRYGDLGGFWFDGWWDQRVQGEDSDSLETYVDWRLSKTYSLINELQHQALIGNNHHVAPFPGETFQMFEKDLPGHNTTGFSGDATVGSLPLETCETINQSWGFNKNDRNFKSLTELIHYLVRAAGYNSNLLLNVGPTPEGTIQPEFETRLRQIGQWMSRYGETIYGTRGGPMPPQSWGVMTQEKDRLYLHILDRDAPEDLVLPGTAGIKISEVRLYANDAVLLYGDEGDLSVELPKIDRDPVDTILVLRRLESQ